MIEKLPFGKTGHLSSRVIFGAAAFWGMRQERADQVLEMLLEYDINHIDVAASYGDAELRIGPWMQQYRDRFFLASKTEDRTAAAARDSIHRSLERLQTDHLDLIQLHNLTDEEGWQTAMGPGGALEAAIDAREKGLVRFIGVTGHGTRAAAMHLRSLGKFAFDSVLLPCNYPLLQNREYAADFSRLVQTCRESNVAVQTIKAIARRRWRKGDTSRHFSWYEPIREPEVLERTVHWLLGHPGLFLNSSSDTTLLRHILKAADEFENRSDSGQVEKQLQADLSRLDMEPIFKPGLDDVFDA